ncbi:hypothetical protein RF11_00730 [Thelohanellus kitauei]|uniref:ISXO2-like transposase domain-containing protein n=1 Tax=Thelohanellus kitauei TaxID=669202 RepID=A0A0C2N4V8_THEKT|nr:hypothetical protein RF11_00730 [Thelohanellus kitauei]
MKLTVIRNRDALKEIIRRNVAPGSIIFTDGFEGYDGFKNEYVREVVIHEHEFVNADGFHTQRIEATCGACKRLFRINTNRKRELMFSYLCEYVFRKKFPKDTLAGALLVVSLMYPLH